MPDKHDYRARDTGEVGGGELMGNSDVRLAGSGGPEDGAFHEASSGATEPRSAQAGRHGADANRLAETPPKREPPLITAIEIENFKGIGRPVRIELRPITLLFGRNSAGKSTVLNALCYAHEILTHRNPDAHKTDLGGDQIDLGGFRRFVHGHDLKRSVRLRFELNLMDRELPDLSGWGTRVPTMWPTGEVPLLEDGDVLSGAEAGWLELAIEWNEERNEPIVSRYEVWVDGHLVGRIDTPDSSGKALLLANLSHPLLEDEVEAQETDVPFREVQQVRETGGSAEYGQGLRRLAVLSVPSSALPPLSQMLWITRDGAFGALGEDSRYRLAVLLPGIGGLLRDELTKVRYLGPLRDLHPSTGVERERSVPGRWANGSAAWDLLNRRAQVTLSRIADDLLDSGQRNRAMVVRRVSDWLSREDRLDTGYGLRVQSAVELPANTPLVDVLNKGVLGEDLAAIKAKEANVSGTESPGDALRKAPSEEIDALARGIAEGRVHREIQLVTTTGGDMQVRTSDIGVGISQILPVVVAALDPDRPAITAIEQPELHVHPRLQVELGDLFAEQAAGGGVFLIETHSEHLMLRLLRRIEETTSGELPAGKPALKPDQVSVVYVEQGDGEVRATRLRIDETGEFIDRWPQGFFDERDDELF